MVARNRSEGKAYLAFFVDTVHLGPPTRGAVQAQPGGCEGFAQSGAGFPSAECSVQYTTKERCYVRVVVGDLAANVVQNVRLGDAHAEKKKN